MLPYYQEGVQGGIFPADGGAARAAANDLEFFALAGQIKGDGVKAEDFWTLRPAQGGAGAASAPDFRTRPAGRARRAVWLGASFLLFFAAWEVAGRWPVAPAFLPSAGRLSAFLRMTLDGSFARAYASTLQPLLIGMAISRGARRRGGREPWA